MSARSAGSAPAPVLRLVMALLTVLLLASGCRFDGLSDLPLPGSPEVGDEPITVTAEFSDVLALAEDATVRLDGVTVGRVAAVRREGWHAAVDLEIQGDVELPADVRARVAQTSLLGEKYVDLVPPTSGGAGTLQDGATIALVDTSRGREVEEVLGTLSLLLNGGGVGQLRTIAVELDYALRDTEVTRSFLRRLDDLVTTLDDNRDTVVETLENVDRLAGTVARNRRLVERTLVDVTPAVRVLARQRQQLVSMLDDLDDFSGVATRVVQRSGQDLRADLEALAPVLDQLAAAGTVLPHVVETILSFPFPDEVLDAVKGDFVNLDVLMDLNALTVAGNVLGDDEQLGGLLTPPASSGAHPSGDAGDAGAAETPDSADPGPVQQLLDMVTGGLFGRPAGGAS